MEMNRIDSELREVAFRIREMREIAGYSVEEMAVKVDLTVEEYISYESGADDLPFSFIHKCAKVFGIGKTDLLEGRSSNLSSYTVTRKNQGKVISKDEDEGIEINHLALLFRNKLAEPYLAKYEYKEELQNKEIATTTHSGQEFDYVISGKLKIRVGKHTEVLQAGDSIYYRSSTPHGMIAVDGEDCTFLAVVIAGEDTVEQQDVKESKITKATHNLVVEKFIETTEDENGVLQDISFKDEDKFNFAYDVVDAIADKYPDKLALLHVSDDFTERRFTFNEIKKESSRAANYFRSLGIEKGDRVMLVLKRHYQFWICALALHKLGAVMIPATNQLVVHDFEYRFEAAGVKAIVCTSDGETANQVDEACKKYDGLSVKVVVNGEKDGWHSFDREYKLFRSIFEREEDSACGDDSMLMFFTSGTTGYPKIACHSFKYALGHFITAKYWHSVQPTDLHLTISDTGWGKALWGKFYGQWMSEGAVFTYDFDRFDASKILPMFAKYNITTFCAPPTMYRMLIKEDLSKYDLSSIRYATTAGEALNPEVFYQFQKATGLVIMEGFGQTETTLTIGNLVGTTPKPGAMGKPVPGYDIAIVDPDGNPCPVGETGEIVVRTDKKNPCGLFKGYFRDEEKTAEVWYDGMYHTGDTAWCDEDGYYWYVSRIDDVIKSSGYRIGPFEIENVIMELPYVLECGVSAAPDEMRGQVVKASIVLTKGTEPTEELKKEIQNYVKKNTAPYKYPRIVVFRDELPKTISGKIQRNKL